MIRGLILFITILPWSCVNYQTQTREDILVLEDTEIVGKDSLFSSIQYLNNEAFSYVTNKNGIFQDQLWGKDWEDPRLAKKVVYWSTTPYQQVRQQSFFNNDLSEMAGFELSPIITYMDNAQPWVGRKFIQHHISVPAQKPKTAWTDGPLTYYLKPTGSQYNLTSKLPQFPSQHPQYTLPKDKMSVLNFSFEGENDRSILGQGHSFIFSYNLPTQKRSFYDYDNWLYEAGCPKAYSTSDEVVIKWLDQVDENVLLSSFKKNFVQKYKDYGYVVMNWEAIGWAYGKSFWKLQRCFDYWHSQQTNARLAIWGKGGFVLNRLQIESNDYVRLLTKAITQKQDLNTFRQGISQSNPLAVDDFYAKNADVLFIGGYLNYPTNFGYVHHFLIQHLLNKMYFPEKKSILSWWNHQEYVGDFARTMTSFKSENGRFIKKEVKPMVFPDAMHNASMWAHAFCDGGDLWSEPYARMEDERYLGASTEAFDEKGRKLRAQFKPKSNAQHVFQNHQNIDRWESAKWAVAQQKDIIDANTKWAFLPSRRLGANKRFTEGEEVLPSVSLYKKTPLVAAKKSADGSEVLLMVYDAWADPTRTGEIQVLIEDQELNVKVFGRYTSLVRFESK